MVRAIPCGATPAFEVVPVIPFATSATRCVRPYGRSVTAYAVTVVSLREAGFHR